MNTPTMPRMTVTGERIISPVSDPINRNTDAAKKARALISGAETDGSDAQDNRPREVVAAQKASVSA